MNVKYRMTVRDLAAFNLHYFVHNWIFLALYGVMLFFSVKNQLAVFHSPMSPGRITFVLVVATVIWAVLIALMFVLGFLICLLPSTLRNTLTEHTIELTDEGVLEVTRQTRLETRWAGVQRLGVTRRYLFLYFGPCVAHLIPKRSVSDEAEWNGIVAECQRRYAAARA